MVTKFEFGSLGEEYFRDWLLRNGYHLVPTSLIQTGGAPLLEGHIKQYVLPDFLAAKSGQCLWVDVKLKRRTTRNAKRQRWETGCALRQFEDYLSVQRTTGIPGALAFIHVEEKKLHLGTLDDLNVDRADWLHDGRGGHAFSESMVFFNLDRFDWYDMDEDGLYQKLRSASTPPKTVRAWEPIKLPERKPERIQRSLWESES